MLTVGLDLRGSSPDFKEHFGRGTGRYATELSRRLVQDSGHSDGCQIVPLYLESVSASPWQRKLLQLAPAGRQTLETQLFLPRRFERLPVDVIHFLAHGDATARCQKPYIVTVLDLIPLRFPELYKAEKPGWRYHLARYFENSAARRAQGVLAISEATKRDVIELLGFPAEEVFVTHLAAGPEFCPRPQSEDLWRQECLEVKRRFGLPLASPLLLYSGGIDPRKNLPFLLRVLRETLNHHGNKGQAPVLCLVGRIRQSDRYAGLQADIRALGLQDFVHEVGFVSDSDLRRLYSAADLFVFPSLYEGFGLPVLEAMSCGVPVLAGNNSSLSEVGGRAARLLPDNDQTAWAQEILSILASPSRQAELSELGLRQAKLFTWEKTASNTIEAYKYFNQLRDWEKRSGRGSEQRRSAEHGLR